MIKLKFFHQTVSYVIRYLLLFHCFFLGALTKKLTYQKLSPIFIRTPVRHVGTDRQTQTQTPISKQLQIEKVIYLVAMTSNPHQEVIRFDISVNEVLVVDILYSSDHLQLEK